jgi:hypothetical protein
MVRDLTVLERINLVAVDQLHKGTFAQIILTDTNTDVTFAQIKF